MGEGDKLNIKDFNLITDRASSDVAQKTAKGSYTADDLNRVNAAMDYVQSKFAEAGYSVRIKRLHIDRPMLKQPFDVSLTNIIKNGDFSNGTTDWTINSSNTVTVDADGTAKATTTTDGTGTYPNYQLFDELARGHLYYYSYSVTGRKENKSYPRVYVRYYTDGSTSGKYIDLVPVNGDAYTTGLNTFSYVRVVGTLRIAQDRKYDRLAFGINDHKKDDAMWIKNIMLVDLTEAFGAGNEPTTDWCKANLPKYFADYTYHDKGIADTRPKDKWYMTDVPNSQQLAEYLANIKALRDKMRIETALPENMRKLTYQQANDIEQILLNIDGLLSNIAAAYIYSGEIFSGEA